MTRTRTLLATAVMFAGLAFATPATANALPISGGFFDPPRQPGPPIGAPGRPTCAPVLCHTGGLLDPPRTPGLPIPTGRPVNAPHPVCSPQLHCRPLAQPFVVLPVLHLP